jgi:hypothetical protein
VVHAVAADLGAVGGDAARALLLDYQAAALSTTDDRALDDLMYGALQRTNGALHDAHRLYWLDIIGDGRSGPLVVSYYVSRSSAVHVDGVTIPLLHLQRLDSLNRSLAALGYTSPRVGAAVVTLDTLEDEAVSLLLPALGDDAVAHTVDAETEKHAPDWVLPLERRVGAVLRAEVPVARRAALAEIAGLLAGRADLLATLRRAAAWSDESISAPKRLVDSARFEELEGRVARGLLDDWRSTNDTLAEPRLREATDAYLSALASIVGRHEIQHQIDFRSGIIPVPADLRETLGARGGTDLAPTSLEARCRDELSAELAAIASTRELASTALSMAVIPVFDQRDWGSPYAYVAASLLTALGRELGGSGEIYADGGAFRRDDAAAAYLAIASKSGPEIAAGAGRAYARLFGHELPTVEVGAWQISPRWSR